MREWNDYDYHFKYEDEDEDFRELAKIQAGILGCGFILFLLFVLVIAVAKFG